MKAFIHSEEVRNQFADSVFSELDAKLDRMSKALEEGGFQHAEQLGKDLGSLIWHVGSLATGVGGAAKGSAELAKIGVHVGADSLKVLKEVAVVAGRPEVGFIRGFKSAEKANAAMIKKGWLPAWEPGTTVINGPIKPGARVQMVVDEKNYRIYTNGEMGNIELGGWATFDRIPNQKYARERLAITEKMKSEVKYVFELELVEYVNAEIGVVGRQGSLMGGGNQIHFILNSGDRNKYFKIVGARILP